MAAPMYYNSMPPTGNHSHIICGGCSVLLMYPQGAANVRCSRCNHITSAPPPAVSGPESAQLVCSGCRMLLSYPRGANSVQCSVCQAITQVPIYGHVVCGGCSIMLMYPLGAQSVKCSVCNFVTSATQGHAMQQPPPHEYARPQPKPNQTIVVENPPTLDDQGNEVANIAVGVKASAGDGSDASGLTNSSRLNKPGR